MKGWWLPWARLGFPKTLLEGKALSANHVGNVPGPAQDEPSEQGKYSGFTETPWANVSWEE
jgi:hypothetical protein